jgi:hypothetical protein
LGNFVQGEIAAMMQPPVTHSMTHRCGRFIAHGGGKTREEFSLAVSRRPGSKGPACKIRVKTCHSAWRLE